LHAVSYGDEFCIAVPAQEEGHVLTAWFRNRLDSSQSSSTDGSEVEYQLQFIGKSNIKVNESGVACLALNTTGTILAAASTKVSLSLPFIDFRVPLLDFSTPSQVIS
jgi:hypothetical protein